MNELLIATQNQGKVNEFEAFFKPYHIKVKSLLDLDHSIPDVEETGETFTENAILKAETISKLFDCPVLADDSGLEVEALNGEPGVYSARYAGKGKNDEENNKKLLQALKEVPQGSRDARFVCVLAVAIPGEETLVYEGFCDGEIVFSPRGHHGFGYDPIFQPKGYEKTMAELGSKEKNKISHRNHALKQLKNWTRLKDAK